MATHASTRQSVRFLHLACENRWPSAVAEAWFEKRKGEWHVDQWLRVASWREKAKDLEYGVASPDPSLIEVRPGSWVKAADLKYWEELEGLHAPWTRVDANVGVRLRLWCSSCAVHIPVDMLDCAAEAHPGQRESGWRQIDEALVAYVADRGEVLYRLDHHAEELARRDRKAHRRVRIARQARSRNGNALGLGGRDLAGANPRVVG